MRTPETAPSRLRDARLVYVAPESGSSGVGDYASDFIEAVRPHFGSVVEYRHRGPGTATLRELLAHREKLRALIEDPDAPPTIVHAEQSGGGMLPFWGPYRVKAVANTATVHDPPLGIWFPLRTRFLARNRIVGHAINLPLSLVAVPLEARINAGRDLFALTRTGSTALRSTMSKSTVTTTSLFVPQRPALPPVPDRPLAIGLFGYVYRGKGFDSLRALRDQLDDDIEIRVAGRGTDTLPSIPGVRVLGQVDGQAEHDFFASIRMLMVPYNARTVYFREAIPAASTVSRAIAYQTPVLSTAQGALRELEEDGGSVVVQGGATELAAAANVAVRDIALLNRLESEAASLRRSRSAEAVIKDFLAVWESKW
jgi:glycosyltransferase involved in cell wall biosynthesis